MIEVLGSGLRVKDRVSGPGLTVQGLGATSDVLPAKSDWLP